VTTVSHPAPGANVRIFCLPLSCAVTGGPSFQESSYVFHSSRICSDRHVRRRGSASHFTSTGRTGSTSATAIKEDSALIFGTNPLISFRVTSVCVQEFRSQRRFCNQLFLTCALIGRRLPRGLRLLEPLRRRYMAYRAGSDCACTHRPAGAHGRGQWQ
jgi:hypothetical protein